MRNYVVTIRDETTRTQSAYIVQAGNEDSAIAQAKNNARTDGTTFPRFVKISKGSK